MARWEQKPFPKPFSSGSRIGTWSWLLEQPWAFPGLFLKQKHKHITTMVTELPAAPSSSNPKQEFRFSQHSRGQTTESTEMKGCYYSCSCTGRIPDSFSSLPPKKCVLQRWGRSQCQERYLSEIHNSLFFLSYITGLCISLAVPQRFEAVTATSLLREGVLRVSFIYKHNLQVLWIAPVNGSHQWCSIRDIRISSIYHSIYFSPALFMYLYAICIYFHSPLGNKAWQIQTLLLQCSGGNKSLLEATQMKPATLFQLWLKADLNLEFQGGMPPGPAGCFLFTLHTLYFFILFSVLQHTVFSTNSYFMKIMCQNLESAIFYKDTKAGPQFRKVLICMLCAL